MARIEAVYPMLSLEVTDSLWLWLEREGVSRRALARRAGLSVRTIQLGLERARAREATHRPGGIPRPPRLLPLFGCRPFVPQSECPHHGPIPAGDRVCCMVCSRSGVDDHPALQRDPRTDPPREKRGRPVGSGAAAWAKGRETRRQRRARLFAQDGKSVTG